MAVAPVNNAQVAIIFEQYGDATQRFFGNFQADISKARQLLGWVPPVAVDEGLRKAVVGLL